ncbi:unnamed protein product [Peniophora sp. CBMAI 1063]|nr:unnamed protein product [Peniophora sp. CBMAI 1063]
MSSNVMEPSGSGQQVASARRYRPAEECGIWVPHPEGEADWEVPSLVFASEEEESEWHSAIDRCRYAAYRAQEAERAQALAAERTRFWIEQYCLAYLSREAKADRAVSTEF